VRTNSFKVVLLTGLVIASLVIALGLESMVAVEGEGSKALQENSPESDCPEIGLIKVCGGTGTDWFNGVTPDFAVGYTDSPGTFGQEDALMVRYLTTPTTLTFDRIKHLGGSKNERFNAATEDASYVFAVGYTNSVGAGSTDALLARFDRANIDGPPLVVVYGGMGDDQFWGVTEDANYVYAVGWTTSFGTNGDALIVKFRRNPLQILESYICGGTEFDRFFGVTNNTDYIYAVGDTNSPPTFGMRDAWIVRFNKGNPITYGGGRHHGSTVDDIFYGVTMDQNVGTAVYAVGCAGLGSQENALIVQYNYNTLGFIQGKIYDSSTSEYYNLYDSFTAAANDGGNSGNIYAVGYTYDAWAGDALIGRIGMSNLPLSRSQILAGSLEDEFWGVTWWGGNIYAVGSTQSVPPGWDWDALMLKLDDDIPPGQSALGCLIYENKNFRENSLQDNVHLDILENFPGIENTGLMYDNMPLDENNCHIDPIPNIREIHLVGDWNLVGLPLVNENTTKRNLFTEAGVDPLIVSMLWFDPYTGYWPVGLDEQLKDNRGYWIRTDNSVTIWLP